MHVLSTDSRCTNRDARCIRSRCIAWASILPYIYTYILVVYRGLERAPFAMPFSCTLSTYPSTTHQRRSTDGSDGHEEKVPKSSLPGFGRFPSDSWTDRQVIFAQSSLADLEVSEIRDFGV